MRLPAAVTSAAVEVLGEPIESVAPVSGGCIHQAACLRSASRTVFVKWSQDAPAGLFQMEAEGLMRLRATDTVAVPEVLAQSDALLVLRWIEPRGDRDVAMAQAGRSLARLHAQRGSAPGLDQDGYIATLAQKNGPQAGESWVSFFREHRVHGLTRTLPAALGRRVEALDLEKLLTEPEGGCALLHGDLWGGNVVCGTDGRGWLVDPASYFGHPEVDLAMTTLFGGFEPSFYAAYQEIAGPFDSELHDRLQVLNLYPLLVHAQLFGSGYHAQIDAVARRFGAA